MTMQPLPVIAFHRADAGSAFVASLREFGFAALVDHPLDMDRVARIYRDWRDFFAHGDPGRYAMDPVRQDGFFSTGVAEHAKGQTRRDFKEYFQYYPWGRCPDSLLADIAGHYGQALGFAGQLLRWVADYSPAAVRAGFSEPLDTMIAGSRQSMLRILHYPPVPAGTDVTRAAAHEDINLLTVLPAADGPGLEIRRRDGSWLAVPNRPDQVLVNIGDMLAEVSGGYFPSTTHRVAAPSGAQLREGRMSLPLFLHPRPEVVLSPRYTAHGYLSERLHELGVA